MCCKYFLPVCGLPFGSLSKVLHVVEIFNFIKFMLLIVLLWIGFWCCFLNLIAKPKVMWISF